jgi:G:T/U-mismatch repair DNA glycosylase
MGGYLPPVLGPGLKVVFVGTEPGSESLRTNCYYANSSNSFWRDLFAARMTPTVIAPSKFASVLTLGIGLDDVYLDPKGLRRRIEAAAPRAVCFNSKAALERMGDDEVKGAWAGRDAGRWVSFPGSLVWALHDSSQRAVAFHALRIEELEALAGEIESL